MCSACKMNLLPPEAVVGQQHPRVVAHPQRHVGFDEDCTHKSHSQLHAVEESTVICDSKWAEDKQSRDLAGGNHNRLTSETESSLCKQASPRLPVVPQSSCIYGRTIAAGQGSSYGSLDFKVASPAMLTGGVSTRGCIERVTAAKGRPERGR